jgi:hypothetical protein
MSDILKNLAPQLHVQNPASQHPGEELLEVSAPASSAATVYEKIRNTFDYQEDHLLRRNAILRILKRYAGAERDLSTHAPDLLRELVWAKYLPNKSIPLAFSKVIEQVIEKYEVLLQAAQEHPAKEREQLYRWIFDVLATDIDHLLVPTAHEEALASFMYDALKKRIDWDPALVLSEGEKDLRLYTAVHRVLLKSNPGILRFRLLTLYYPDWQQASPERVQEIAAHLPHIVRTIESDIVHPLADRLMRLIRRKAGLFRVLEGALQDAKPDASLFNDPAALDRAITKALEKRVQDFRVRLRRTVIRSVLFLFLTKMLLALIIELPYDLFLHGGNVPMYPLFVNIFFHPVFLAIIGLSVGLPGESNAADYTVAARAISVGADHPYLHTRVKAQKRTSWTTAFAVLYGILFLAVYSAIGYTLHILGFHGLSIVLFLLFLSLVTFFGIRIRMSVRDIVLSDARSGFLGSFFDVLFLPIVRAGSWLSTKVSKINVFIYFFDFIIEAPLKVAIEFVEGWLTFVREKKEEI